MKKEITSRYLMDMPGLHNFWSRLLLTTLIFAGGIGSAFAEDAFDTPFGKRFMLAIGAYGPKLDTVVQLGDADGDIGTRIDFESDFSMTKRKTLPQLRASWQMAQKHRLDFSYFSLARNGNDTSTVNIKWGDKEFEAGEVPIQAFFDVDVYSLHYSYALVADPVKEFSVSIGLSVQDIATGLRGTLAGGDDSIVAEEVGVTAPLPSIGLGGSWAFTDNRKWILNYNAGVFALDLDLDKDSKEEISGRLIDGGIHVYHKTFKHIGFGAGIDYFRIKVDYRKRGLIGDFDYSYIGPGLYVTGFF